MGIASSWQSVKYQYSERRARPLNDAYLANDILTAADRVMSVAYFEAPTPSNSKGLRNVKEPTDALDARDAAPMPEAERALNALCPPALS